MPSSGVLRVLGEVVVEDEPGYSLDGAIAGLFLDATGAQRVVATAQVSPSGRFHLDYVPARARSWVQRDSQDLELRVEVPGCWRFDETLDPSTAKGGVIRVVATVGTEGPLLRLRAVTGAGDPVQDAEVGVLVSDPIMAESKTWSGRTASDGRLAITLLSPGWATVTVTHTEHGATTRSAELAFGTNLLDLGELVLIQRNPASGRVVGYDGYGIPGHDVGVSWTRANGKEANQMCLTDAEGRFTFGLLEPVECRFSEESVLGCDGGVQWATPPSSGLVLRVPRPTIEVTVRGPDGLPVRPSHFEVVPIDAAGLSTAEEEGAPWIFKRDLGEGCASFLLEEPGIYGAFATLRTVEGSFSAMAQIDIGKEHQDVSLTLRRDERRPIAVDVQDSDSRSLQGWSLRAFDLQSGVEVASATSEQPELSIQPGSFRIEVSPQASGYFRGFSTQFDQENHAVGDPLVLIAPMVGGRIRVTVAQNGDGKRLGYRLSAEALDGLARVAPNRWQRQGKASVSPPLPAGSYVVTLERKASVGVSAASYEKTVLVNPGETAESEWCLTPAARNR